MHLLVILYTVTVDLLTKISLRPTTAGKKSVKLISYFAVCFFNLTDGMALMVCTINDRLYYMLYF